MQLVEQVELLKVAHPGLVLKWRQQRRGHVCLDLIYLPLRQRRQGHGSRVMADLVAWADTEQVVLSLEPLALFETPLPVLHTFYARFGFQQTSSKIMTRRCANTSKV